MRLQARRPGLPSYTGTLVTLGNHLRARRTELGLSQEQLAERLDVALASISNWERDNYAPDPKRLPAIYDFIGCCLVGNRRPLGERLVAWRHARGLSPRQVAQQLGVTTRTVRRLETTNTRPTVAVRDAVERLLLS